MERNMGRISFTEKTTKLAEEYVPAPALDYLTEAEARVWFDTLSSLEPGWITAESHEQLAAYCQRVVNIHNWTAIKNKLESEILPSLDPLDPLPIKQMERIQKAIREETAQMMALTRALRITNQSRRAPSIGKGATVQTPAPEWE